MLRQIKFLLLGALLLAAVAMPASAFSLLGLPDGRFQTTGLGYDPAGFGGPMNLGEEYRWTTPVITYAFDESFLNYFGVAGITAIDSAFQVYNELPAADEVETFPGDPNLYFQGNPIPVQTTADNFQALALNLVDVKSHTMALIAQYLGLAHAENWIWCLRDRQTFNNGANTNYLVIKRNFDPITWEPTNSVNTAVYSYFIFDGTPGSDAVESLVSDPLSTGGFTTVAGGSVPVGRVMGLGSNLGIGQYYTGLTRDDVAGLRYMLRFNNFNLEALRGGFTNTPNQNPYSPVGGGTNGTNTAIINALRPGIGKVSFRRINFDSLVNIPGINPYTNSFTDYYITNNTLKSQVVRMIATVPDILIAATDLGDVVINGVIAGPVGTTTSPGVTAGFYVNSTANNALYPISAAAQPGPGTIGQNITGAAAPGSFVYNKIGPSLINRTPAFLTELTASPTFNWGSFDGSANPPIVYPNGASIQQLEQQLFLNR